MKRPLTLIMPAIAIFACLGYTGYTLWGAYRSIPQAAPQDEARAIQASNDRAHLSDMLSRAGIGAQDIADGFWYSYRDPRGAEHVLFADINALAAQHLDDLHVASLAAQIASSTVIHKSDIVDVQAQDLPLMMQFRNQLNAARMKDAAMTEMAAVLRARLALATTSETLFELSSLDDRAGDIGERDYLNGENCRLFHSRCRTYLITLQGRVMVDTGRLISGASVSVADRTNIRATTTDAFGRFSLPLSINPLESLRVRIRAADHTDTYANVAVLVPRPTYDLGYIRLRSADDASAPANTPERCVRIIEGNGACGDGTWGPWVVTQQTSNDGVLATTRQRIYTGTRSAGSLLPYNHVRTVCGAEMAAISQDASVVTDDTVCELAQTQTSSSPAPARNPRNNARISVSTSPQRVQNGDPVSVSWHAAHASSCAVSGSNGDIWTGLTSPRGGQISSPIASDTTFTLSCLAGDGMAFFATSSVSILPSGQ